MVGAIYDAAQSEAFARAILAGMRERRAIESGGGRLQFSGTRLLAELQFPESQSVRRVGVEQSNSSVILDDLVMLKIYRRLQPGLQPEIEIGRFLTEVAGFENTPAYLGSLERTSGEGELTALATALSWVPNQGDGWNYTLGWLQRFLDDEALASLGAQGDANALFADYVALAETLGRRTAELHRALAPDGGDPAFAAEPITMDDMKAWANLALEQHDLATHALRRALPGLEGGHARRAEVILGNHDLIRRRIAGLAAKPVDALKTRIHGDYHLGQVLVSHNDFFIIDFEGEPSRPLDQRRRKSSPLKDVAGMLRSFDYAAYSAMQWADEQPVQLSAATAAAQSWRRLTEEAFLKAYVETISGVRSWPGDEDARRLLDLFLLEKALYEVVYEASNRPRWLSVPLSGLARILGLETIDAETAAAK
jgi:maltose alpha-D-glucosyltransferase/alpha-amylase